LCHYSLRKKGTFCLHRKTTNAYKNNSCCTAGVTSWSLAIGQAFPGTGFRMSFYEDDTLPFLLETLDIFSGKSAFEGYSYVYLVLLNFVI
jgi:hypothetical protein